MDWQLIAVILIIACAVAYAVYAIVRSCRRKDASKCCGCPLQKRCTKK